MPTALGVLSAVLGAFNAKTLLTQALAAQPQDQAVSTAILSNFGYFLVAAGAIGVLIQLLLILYLRLGRNWARIVLTIVTAISWLGAVQSITRLGTELSSGVIGVLTALIDIATVAATIAAVVLMWRRECSVYFDSAGWIRRYGR